MKKDPLTISIEASSGQGEDAHLVIHGQTVTIGVFDGLGGKSVGFGKEKGGRIASREASKRTKAFLEKSMRELSVEDVYQIQEEVCHYLKQEADTKIKSSRLKGTLADKRLCTTLALVSIPEISPTEHLFDLSIAWIGDSRIYFLSYEKGLQQLTKDDLNGYKDAFKIIREDSPMSQHLTADMPSNWRINFKVESFKEKGCVIACTDGCFQCLDSPWVFEKLILDTLAKSNTVTDWQRLLTQKYEKIKQDDVSFVLYPVGFDFDDFEFLKSCYKARLDKLNESFPYVYGNYEDSVDFWNKYRLHYEERLIPAEERLISVVSENHFNEPAYEKHEISVSEKIKSDDERTQTLIDNDTENSFEISEKRGNEASLLEENKPDALKSTIISTKIPTEAENKLEISDSVSDLGLLVEESKFNDASNDSVLDLQNKVVKCPNCQSEQISKKGYTSTALREQRYKCKSCGRGFQESTKFQDPTDTSSVVAGFKSQKLPVILLIITLIVILTVIQS